jgi:hypothetical protein
VVGGSRLYAGVAMAGSSGLRLINCPMLPLQQRAVCDGERFARDAAAGILPSGQIDGQGGGSSDQLDSVLRRGTLSSFPAEDLRTCRRGAGIWLERHDGRLVAWTELVGREHQQAEAPLVDGERTGMHRLAATR